MSSVRKNNWSLYRISLKKDFPLIHKDQIFDKGSIPNVGSLLSTPSFASETVGMISSSKCWVRIVQIMFSIGTQPFGPENLWWFQACTKCSTPGLETGSERSMLFLSTVSFIANLTGQFTRLSTSDQILSATKFRVDGVCNKLVFFVQILLDKILFHGLSLFSPKFHR